MNDEYMYMLGYYGNGEWMDYEQIKWCWYWKSE